MKESGYMAYFTLDTEQDNAKPADSGVSKNETVQTVVIPLLRRRAVGSTRAAVVAPGGCAIADREDERDHEPV